MHSTKPFTWGASTSAYQIEGAWNTDRKGPSIWDAYCHEEGKILHGDRGDIACDHYHRYQEDVGLMQEIGLQSYRFSISWPRVIPNGTGAVNVKGLEFYDCLVDELLAKGIDPLVTLFHWDYPLALLHRGGWLNADSPKWYADYVAVMAEQLGDRVEKWITFNEPQVFINEGHLNDFHAPGLNLSLTDTLRAGHNVLLAHGLGCQALRHHARKTPKIGWAPAGKTWAPASDKPEDIAAAHAMTFGVPNKDVFNDPWWSDPVVLGHYPEAGLKRYGDAMIDYDPADMQTICQPIDFFAINLYFCESKVAASPNGPATIPYDGNTPRTMMDWPITPEVLYWSTKWNYERYKLPMIISENGLACMDWVQGDGAVHDAQRIDFYTSYLKELKRAMDEGVDMIGYYAWSLMDNFEWSQGYRQRFGLIHVDMETGKRTLKDSAHWYRKVIESNGAEL
jgi:beta-glucosidase